MVLALLGSLSSEAYNSVNPLLILIGLVSISKLKLFL